MALTVTIKKLTDDTGYEVVLQNPSPFRGRPMNTVFLVSNEGMETFSETTVASLTLAPGSHVKRIEGVSPKISEDSNGGS